MNIHAKNGRIDSVKLTKQERTILESAQGICMMLLNNLRGEHVGEAAAKAIDGLKTMRLILEAEVPEPLVSK